MSIRVAILVFLGLFYVAGGLFAFYKAPTGLNINQTILWGKAARYLGGFLLVAGCINLLTFAYLYFASSGDIATPASVMSFFTLVLAVLGYLLGVAIQFGQDWEQRKRRKKEKR